MLRVSEIYTSVQGESVYSGWPCVFVRLTGCPLRCRWCDTVYSFEGGKDWKVDDVVENVKSTGVPMVELTGGEPLAQKASFDLIQKLVDSNLQVLIETGGSEPIDDVSQKAHIIMDLKCPDSGMEDRNLWENIPHLKPSDEIKFVIASAQDFKWAIEKIREFDLEEKCRLCFSPAFGLMKEKALVELLLESGVNARLNLQIHKYVWSPRTKGV